MGGLILKLLLTAAAAFAVGMVLKLLNVPGALMIGGVIGAAVLSVCFGCAYMPKAAKLSAQVLTGAFLGCTMNSWDSALIKKTIKLALILLLGYLCVTMLLGVIISKVADIDLLTAMCCAIPGGTQETPLIAEDMGANAITVALLQFVRMFFGVSLFPIVISHVPDSEVGGKSADKNEKTKKKKEINYGKILVVLIIAGIFGVIGKKLGLPAGALIFALIGTLIIKKFLGSISFPVWMKRLAQLLSGSYVGSAFTRSDLSQIRILILPAVIVVAGFFAFCWIMGFILQKTCGMSRRESMLASTPAGASDMALVSSDMGVESQSLILIHMLRLICVPVIFPQIISFVVNHI